MKADLNQQAAIQHGPGPALVSAGPGSGKTYVLTHRIQFLIQNLGIPPEKILVLTFSNKAASEMKNRFLKLLETNHTKVTFGTFHSVFLHFLQKSGKFQNYRLLKETEEIYFMFRSVKEEKSPLQTEEYAERLLKQYHTFKAKNMCLDSLQGLERRIFKRYEYLKSSERYFDFDDMLIETLVMLKKNPTILKEIQNRFLYVLVDEFQDINPLQYEITGMICKKHRNLFVVGDDDQSIYAFRGATPAIMELFLKDYPETKEYHLYKNYRSHKGIVKRSAKVIKKNRQRIKKKLSAANKKYGEVKYRIFMNKDREYRSLVKDLRRNLQSILSQSEERLSEHHSTHAILLRTNKIPEKLITELKKAGIYGNENIKIMTMHSSKGLEFDYVYLPDLYEGNIPYKLSVTKEEIEEERRVFYVAMTRAERGLYLYGLQTIRKRKKLFNKKTGKYKLSRFYIDSIF